MTEFFNKIESSFRAAMKGEEEVDNMIWWWGVLAYVISYLILNRIVRTSNFRSVDIIVSLVAVIYFIWHIYALRKCAPKKPKLTKEEKQHLREEARKERGKRFMRKLLLQEPISKWDPVLVTTVMDLFCIAHFMSFVVS